MVKSKEIQSRHLSICQKDNHSVELFIAQSMASQTLVYDLKKYNIHRAALFTSDGLRYLKEISLMDWEDPLS